MRNEEEPELGEHLPLLGGQSAAESRRLTYTAIAFCQSLLASGTIYGTLGELCGI